MNKQIKLFDFYRRWSKKKKKEKQKDLHKP